LPRLDAITALIVVVVIIPLAADQERRLQRLQEILDELMALTDWKKD